MRTHGDWLGHDPNLLIPRLKALLADLERVVRSPAYPAVATVAMEDWFMFNRAVPCLTGRSTGHPDIRDGAPTITSEVYFIDFDRRLARTLSRWYHLDNPMEDFPNASEHFQQ